MKTIGIKPVSTTEAKEIMLKLEKEKELSYEQKLALEHLKKFSKLKPSELKSLKDELNSIIRVSDETLVQILNILPKTADELRLIFVKEKFSVKEEEIKKILEVLKKYK